MNLGDLRGLAERSVRSAGPRYTPGQDAAFPNLEIEKLEDAFIGLVGGQSFSRRVVEIRDELRKAFEGNSSILKRAFPRRVRKPAGCLEGLTQLAACEPGFGKDVARRVRRSVAGYLNTCDRFQSELYEKRDDRKAAIDRELTGQDRVTRHYEDDVVIRNIDGQLRALRGYLSALLSVRDFLYSACCQALYNNRVLLIGEWGSGKTHFLCDVALKRLSEEQPAFLVLAKDFEPHPTVCAGMLGHAGVAQRITSLINGLGRLAKRGERALLIIDGINESDSTAWRAEIEKIITQATERSNVALVLSCRSPMHNGIVPRSLMEQMLILNHPGFAEIEFNAQQTFFDFYNIPLPEVPLLADEFSRPLTLKILCEAFLDLPEKSQRAGFAGLSSGQRGMTYILERFIKQRAREPETDLGVPIGFCWSVMKGDNRIRDTSLSGIAPNMAANGVNYVSKEDALDIIESRSVIPDRETASALYRRILAEGLLFESSLWRPIEEGGSRVVVRMPYERFGDHIVARHLLGKYLDVTNEATIRRSLYRNARIGSIFFTNEYHARFEFEGWAEAIIIEFPERVKRVLPEDQTELFFYLPSSWRDLASYCEPFCNGLFWRFPQSISKQSDRIVGAILWSGHETSSRRLLDALLAVATKPAHPYSGHRLYSNFKKMELPDRDLLWSEYLRTRYQSSSADRLVNWLEKPITGSLKPSSVENLLAILSLFLTSTDRSFRDRVTKILVRVGERFPKELFEQTLRTLAFNDPYVPERMLAASYGVTMSLWADTSRTRFRQHCIEFARQLVRRMYLRNGDNTTPHVLMREYSKGVIDISRLLEPRCIATQWVSKTRPPFEYQRGRFPDDHIEATVSEEAKPAMHMDFENYTIGRLIPERANYDYTNTEYIDVRRKIDWRICDLGYKPERFEDIDRAIANRSWRLPGDGTSKVDRYGKKYSWIAYYEMYGLRQAQGLLSDYRQDERCPDCDIDPSFPKRPSDWIPPPHHFFRRTGNAHLDWINNGPSPRFDAWLVREEIEEKVGPWILLDGYVRSEDPTVCRSAFAFLRGVIVDRENVDALREKVLLSDHPGSDLPDSPQAYYTYAGEVPWAYSFRGIRENRSGSGNESEARDAFASTRNFVARKPVKKAWRLVYEDLGEIPSIEPIQLAHTDPVDEATDTSADEAIALANSQVSPEDQIGFADFMQRKPTVEEVEAGYWYVPDWEHVPGIPVCTTSWRYSWESYHSTVNDFRDFRFAAPIICSRLNLSGRNREIDLFDENGERATVYRGLMETLPNQYDALFLRRDLLDDFLAREKKALVWVIWGERGFPAGRRMALDQQPDMLTALQGYAHIFKRTAMYEPA